MTIRAVLMWYLGVLVVIGGSGAAGYGALKQHQAQLAMQEAEPPAVSAAPVATAAVQIPAVAPEPQPAPTSATSKMTAASPTVRPWPPLPKAQMAEAPAAAPAAVQAPAPPALTWAAASRPWASPPKALIAHNSRRHPSRPTVASAHRPSIRSNQSHRPRLYAAARVPPAPRVTYYAYPGYYPYQPGYAYYSHYPRYPYYSTY